MFSPKSAAICFDLPQKLGVPGFGFWALPRFGGQVLGGCYILMTVILTALCPSNRSLQKIQLLRSGMKPTGINHNVHSL